MVKCYYNKMRRITYNLQGKKCIYFCVFPELDMLSWISKPHKLMQFQALKELTLHQMNEELDLKKEAGGKSLTHPSISPTIWWDFHRNLCFWRFRNLVGTEMDELCWVWVSREVRNSKGTSFLLNKDITGLYNINTY